LPVSGHGNVGILHQKMLAQSGSMNTIEKEEEGAVL
jgi:hypothetical protein